MDKNTYHYRSSQSRTVPSWCSPGRIDPGARRSLPIADSKHSFIMETILSMFECTACLHSKPTLFQPCSRTNFSCCCKHTCLNRMHTAGVLLWLSVNAFQACQLLHRLLHSSWLEIFPTSAQFGSTWRLDSPSMKAIGCTILFYMHIGP
jgi:hypothetical protein